MAKGGVLEREISKELSLWWTHGERDDIFWRSHGSGARATVRRKQGKATANQDGDICITDPIGQPLLKAVTIELKNGYAKWNIKSILDSKQKKPILREFFEQCAREKESSNTIGWWLITHQQYMKRMLFFDMGFKIFLTKSGFNISEIEYIMINCEQLDTIYCVRLDDFFKKVNSDIFK